MEEFIAIAKNLGVQCCGDSRDGAVRCRLIISESPLTYGRVEIMMMDLEIDSDWIGTVAVYHGYSSYEFDSNRAVVWGRCFVYGDRS